MANGVDQPKRLTLAIIGVLALLGSGLIYRSIVNGQLDEARDEWIVTQVRDPKNKNFAILDEEAPPSPLELGKKKR